MSDGALSDALSLKRRLHRDRGEQNERRVARWVAIRLHAAEEQGAREMVPIGRDVAEEVGGIRGGDEVSTSNPIIAPSSSPSAAAKVDANRRMMAAGSCSSWGETLIMRLRSRPHPFLRHGFSRLPLE